MVQQTPHMNIMKAKRLTNIIDLNQNELYQVDDLDQNEDMFQFLFYYKY